MFVKTRQKTNDTEFYDYGRAAEEILGRKFLILAIPSFNDKSLATSPTTAIRTRGDMGERDTALAGAAIESDDVSEKNGAAKVSRRATQFCSIVDTWQGVGLTNPVH